MDVFFGLDDYNKLLSDIRGLPPDDVRSKLVSVRDNIFNYNYLAQEDIVIVLTDMGAGIEEHGENIEEYEKQFTAAGKNTHTYDVQASGMITTSGDDYMTVLTTRPIPEEHAKILADLYYSWGIKIGPETGIPISRFVSEAEKVWPPQEKKGKGKYAGAVERAGLEKYLDSVQKAWGFKSREELFEAAEEALRGSVVGRRVYFVSIPLGQDASIIGEAGTIVSTEGNMLEVGTDTMGIVRAALSDIRFV